MSCPNPVLLTIAGLLVACGALEEPDREPDTEMTAERLDQLAALGYVDLLEVDDESRSHAGVTVHDRSLAFDGYNLFTVRDRNLALLLDMSGRVVHRWSAAKEEEEEGCWHLAEMTSEGDLLVLCNRVEGYVARFDWDSTLLWQHRLEAHHDFFAADDGHLFVLDHALTEWEYPTDDGTRLRPTQDDVVVEVGPSGDVLASHSLTALLGASIPTERFEDFEARYQRQLSEGKARPIDLLHTNTLERIDRDLGGLATRGDFLVCMREIDRIAIVDLATQRVEWVWGAGELDGPHQPSVTPDGRILIFDNGRRRRASRIVEVDPADGSITWQYGTGDGEAFFSKNRGGVQRLANGNVLVADSNEGRAFEVTRDRKIVWEYYNEPRTVEGGVKRDAIYRITRIPTGIVEPLLERHGGAGSTPASEAR